MSLTLTSHEIASHPIISGRNGYQPRKVNILLQGYISNAYVEDFVLVSDTAYAAQVCTRKHGLYEFPEKCLLTSCIDQNGGRIVRALLEIALSHKWANVSAVLMSSSRNACGLLRTLLNNSSHRQICYTILKLGQTSFPRPRPLRRRQQNWAN